MFGVDYVTDMKPEQNNSFVPSDAGCCPQPTEFQPTNKQQRKNNCLNQEERNHLHPPEDRDSTEKKTLTYKQQPSPSQQSNLQ